eukprot:12716331-Alexandrium_andersonii.AAC.1
MPASSKNAVRRKQLASARAVSAILQTRQRTSAREIALAALRCPSTPRKKHHAPFRVGGGPLFWKGAWAAA